MNSENFDTLSQAVNSLTKEGYKDSFIAKENCLKTVQSKKEYQPDELKIEKAFRFDGMTNPSDESEVFAIKANDGTKGTLIMTHGSDHNHNVELIKDIKKAN
jgi:cobalamin biosynthesis Co2+ chelatase CbiK